MISARFNLKRQRMNHNLYFFFAAALVIATPVATAVEDTFLGRSADQWSELLTSSSGQKRIHAAWAMAQLAGRFAGGPSDQVHFAELVKLVSDDDATVRYWGVIGLTAYGQRLGKGDGGQAAVVNTLEPLLGDEAAAPRLAAAAALGTFGHTEKALQTLVAALNDPQESVRIQAVAALEKLGPAAKSAEDVLRKATSDSSEYVKRISERALSRLQTAKK
jgi:HEAT repeats